ncbi:SPOR domain-containing protein [Flavobacterium sp.]|uniref:SPOR domain-containing protein n=1 Tax=Flavobacterium sp. TaxID=239 RepID=UPI00286AAC6F|nr:SPOR domain-containing protein [Flavobacterium sp.]
MRILGFLRIDFKLIVLVILSANCYAQSGKTSITQDQRFEQLLNEKRKINSSITLSDRFKIQIFTGDSETSKVALQDFRKKNKDIDATIVFNTPIYKVWVGNFKTRIEAEKKLQDFKKKYPNAFLIKPNK